MNTWQRAEEAREWQRVSEDRIPGDDTGDNLTRDKRFGGRLEVEHIGIYL
jgi:hypothetical protein